MRRSVVPALSTLIALSLSSAPSHADPKTVTVVVQRRGTQIDGRTQDGVWMQLCTGPCEVNLPPGSKIQLTTPEGEVRNLGVPANAGERVIADDPEQLARYSTAKDVGLGLTVGGGVITGVGIFWMLVSSMANGFGCMANSIYSGGGRCSDAPDTAAVITSVAGVVILATGVVVLTNRPPAMKPAPPPSPPPPIDTRTPPPSATGALLRPPAPPTMTLVTVHF